VEKVNKSNAPRLSRLLLDLKRTLVSSRSEYFRRISLAASAIGKAASKLAAIEARRNTNPKKMHNPQHTLEVHPTDDGADDFRKIQDAVDNASPGDRIVLKNGVFRSSGVIWVWKDLVIEGEDKNATIEGMTYEHGKVVADPSLNGGFIVATDADVEIRNLTFRRLYFAVSSFGSQPCGHLLFENNDCEDVFHSVFFQGNGPALAARNNKIIITSLDNNSSRCRFSFFDESHVSGFYCDGNPGSVIEKNHLEVMELSDKQPFHAIGAFCSDCGNAAVKNNFFKGWHAPLIIHGSDSLVHNNEIHGLCEDSEHEPIGIMLRGCDDPFISANRISSRNLGKNAVGIAVMGAKKGFVIDNHISLSDAEGGILLHKSHGMIISNNTVDGKLGCPIGLFGDQNEHVTGNVLFGNECDGEAQIMMHYAADNAVIGAGEDKSDEEENVLLGYESDVSHESKPLWGADDHKRQKRVSEHIGKKKWPEIPERYLHR